MKSKKITICFIFLTVIFFRNSFAQKADNNIKPDPRLYDCFDSSYVQHTFDVNKESIIYYNYFLDHSYFISDNDPSKLTLDALDIFKVKKHNINKSGKTESLKEEDVSSFNPKTFNVLMYDFVLDFNNYKTYKLGNTGKLIIFYPKSVFLQMYKEYKKSIGY